MWLTIAQTLNQEFTGASGWASAGLLGLVLSWLLLKHLPAKDEQIMKLLELRDKAVNEQRTDFTSSVRKLGESVQATVERITGHCKEEMEVLANKLGTSVDKMEEALARVLTLREARGARGGGDAH